MAVAETEELLLERLNAMEADALLAWALDAHGDRAAIITSFQDTGCVMIDLMSKVAPGMRVVTVDTLRLHPETYAHMDAMEARYGKIERFTPDPARLNKMVAQHGEYLFSTAKRSRSIAATSARPSPTSALWTVWTYGSPACAAITQNSGVKRPRPSMWTGRDAPC